MASVVDPYPYWMDPYSVATDLYLEYGSGSTHLNIGIKKRQNRDSSHSTD